MPFSRGDVVLVPFPQPNGPVKKRPALVVDSDKVSTGHPDNILVMITSQPRSGPAFVAIPHPSPESAAMGLLRPSAVVAMHFITLQDRLIVQRLGHCPQAQMSLIDTALRYALDL